MKNPGKVKNESGDSTGSHKKPQAKSTRRYELLNLSTLTGCPKTLRKHIMPRNAISNILFYKDFSETLSEKSVINGIYQDFWEAC
jgi:hypothetical protein